MKRHLFITVSMFIVTITASGNKGIISNPVLRTDSVHEYLWVPSSNDWQFQGSWDNPEVHDYKYVDGKLVEITVTQIETGEYIRRELFSRNDLGLVESQIFQNWSEDDWVNVRKDTYQYTQEGWVSDFIRQDWIDGAWSNFYRFINYNHNELGQTTYYREVRWSGSEWVDYADEYWSYNEENKLATRINKYSDGTNRFQFSYYYSPEEMRSEWIHQVWGNNSWLNSVRTITYLNACNQAVSQIRMHWDQDSTAWIDYSKKDFFTSLDFNALPEKAIIPVCHNGHTLYLPLPAVKAHMRHGDCPGTCINNNKPGDQSENQGKYKSLASETFIGPGLTKIFPNPFTDLLTIQIGEDLANLKQLQMIDISGRIIMTYKVNGESEITIRREFLPEGIYFIKFYSDTVWIEKVIAR